MAKHNNCGIWNLETNHPFFTNIQNTESDMPPNNEKHHPRARVVLCQVNKLDHLVRLTKTTYSSATSPEWAQCGCKRRFWSCTRAQRRKKRCASGEKITESIPKNKLKVSLERSQRMSLSYYIILWHSESLVLLSLLSFLSLLTYVPVLFFCHFCPKRKRLQWNRNVVVSRWETLV